MSMDIDRIAVLIGKDGETKSLLEKKTGTILTINGDTGEYNIAPDPNFHANEVEDQIDSPEVRVYVTSQILKAINAGFNPLKALKLLDHEILFETVNLEDTIGHSETRLKRITGRLIGESGKIRNSIEQFAKVNISIYKRYLAIIGDFESLKVAKKAINMLINGAPHKTVLNYLHKEYEQRKKDDFTSLWKPTL
jgi:ribosomal RNA assembly protein